MKVVHVGKYYPPHWGGMETALKDMCEVLAPRLDLEALVAAEGRQAVSEIVGGVRLERLPTAGTLFSQPMVFGLWSRLRKLATDIVHLHEPNPLAMVNFLLSGNRASLIIHYHSDIVKQRRLSWLYRPWLEAGLSRARVIVVGSQELIESSEVLSRWRHKCVVIPFGIDLAPFLAIERGTAGVAQPPAILAVGRLAYYKGFHHLIEAMCRVTGARLTIVGGGPEHGRLASLIAARSLKDRVSLVGRVDEGGLVDHYRRASLFCLPSCERSEAFGLVQLEAMGAGLPLVSTDLPTGMRVINRHRETGLVVPPGDPTSLAAALNELIASPALAAQYGAAGRNRARILFSREAMGAQLLNLYQSVGAHS